MIVLLDLIWSFLIPRTILVVFKFVIFDCVLRFVAVPVSGSHSQVCRFNVVNRDRFRLAFYQDFHDSAAPNDDLVWSVIRGVQRRCYCDSSQKYMRACFEFLILENVFLICVARWAQTKTHHGYP